MAISNCFQWIIYVTLVLTLNCSGYKEERTSKDLQTTQQDYDGSDSLYERSYLQDNHMHLSQALHRRTFGTASRNNVSVRSENGTFKIINRATPYILNQRDSKDEEKLPNVNQAIVFPGDDSSIGSRRKFRPMLTEDCKQGSTICTAVTNYPEIYLTSLLQNMSADIRAELTEDEIEPVKIAQRIGDPEDLELCNFRETIVYPQAAENKDSRWYLILNQPDYRQGFRVEICQSENSSCSYAVFRRGMQARCKQKYVLRKMKAIDENGQIITDAFRLPSCCSCVVRED